MASIISAGTTSGTSLNLSGDTSGVLQLATNGTTTAVTIDTSQNVGIGTSSPAVRLQVSDGGDVADLRTRVGNSVYLELIRNGTSNSWLRSVGNAEFIIDQNTVGSLVFRTSATEAMRITSAGNVGIGTSSPSGSDWNASSTVVQVNKNDTNGGLFKASSSNTNFIFSAGNNLAYIATTTNTPITFFTNTTERMRLTSDGDLLVGNTTSSGKVTATTAAVGSGSTDFNNKAFAAEINFSVVNKIGAIVAGYDGPTIYGTAIGFSYNGTGYDMQFATNDNTVGNPIERMRITSGGDVCVGTTAAISAYALIHVRGDNKGIAIQDSTDNSYRAIYNQSGTLYFWNGTNEGSLSSAGAWTNASDAKLKNSIVDIKYGLNTVLNTQPRSYKMNNLEGEYIGFVAQELQTVIPEVVSGNPDKQLNVDYGSLVAVAFKAIQELNAKVVELEAKLNAK